MVAGNFCPADDGSHLAALNPVLALDHSIAAVICYPPSWAYHRFKVADLYVNHVTINNGGDRWAGCLRYARRGINN
jgi:hypothetical protein